MAERNGRRVAVTGLGFITPIGFDAETVWSHLVEGASPVSAITYFDPEGHPSRIAAQVKGFDPLQFMDGKTERNASRYCQYGLAAAKLAMADAGLEPGELPPEDFGVVVGSAYGGIYDCERAQMAMVQQGNDWISPFAAAMIGSNMAPAVIAMHVRAGGINFAVTSACASGTNAIGEAAEIVRSGRAQVMLTGGAEAAITPLMLAMYNRLSALSQRNDEPERASRPWDSGRDGFVFGEGSVILVLEEMEHALARGARIRAEVAGYGAATDMYHYTAPDPEGRGAARSMRRAVESANLRLEDVDYINAHATSTRLGDLAETKAIKRVFGDHAKKLVVSSTKSVHAHLMGAAGAIEAAACVLAIEHGTAPPTANLDNQDPECDLDYAPLKPRKLDLRVAISNSFGLGGHDATVVLRKVEPSGAVSPPGLA